MDGKTISSHFSHHSPLLCLAAFVKLHLKGGGTGAGEDAGLMAAILVVVRRLPAPGPQHHWLLGLVPALLIHLTATWKVTNMEWSQVHLLKYKFEAFGSNFSIYNLC